MNSSPRWTGLGLMTVGALAGLAAWWSTSATTDADSATAGLGDHRSALHDSPPTDPVEVKRVELDPVAAMVAGQSGPPQLPISASMRAGDSAVMLTSEDPSRVRRSPAAVEWEIQQLVLQDASRRRIASCINELAADGSAEALDVLIGLLGGTEPDFVGKAEMLSRALLGVDDERVYPAALHCYQDLAGREQKDGSGIRAALRLVVSHGGTEGSEHVLAMIDGQDPTLRALGASMVAELDRACANQLAMIVRSKGPMSGQVLYGLLHWRSPEGHHELLQLAYDDDIEDAARESIVRGMAQTAPLEVLPELTRMYWNAANQACKRLSLNAVQSFDKNPDLPADQREKLGMPVISAALVDDDVCLRAQAAAVLEAGDYARSSVEPLLRQALAMETDTEQIQRLVALIESLQNS